MRYDSPGRTVSSLRSPSSIPVTPERSAGSRQGTNYEPPASDYGPSRNVNSTRRSPIDTRRPVVAPESSIKVPEVPPLPSPFDPNYASIMATRHKMLLSRQRALLHRRATREQTQQQPSPSAQGGFFGRTHPERPTRVAEVRPSIQLTTPAQEAPPRSTRSDTRSMERPGSSVDDTWETFGPNDPTLKAFEALTRPSRRSPIRRPQHHHSATTVATPSRNTHRDHPHMYTSTAQPTTPQRRRAPPRNEASQRTATNTSLFSKVKSSLGLESEYRTASQSEAVIARITAVRAARMKRYHETNNAAPPTRSYRQRVIDRGNSTPGYHEEQQTVGSTSGYRFYTHEEDNVKAPNTFEAKFSTDGGDSLSTTSNAVEYAATLEVD